MSDLVVEAAYSFYGQCSAFRFAVVHEEIEGYGNSKCTQNDGM